MLLAYGVLVLILGLLIVPAVQRLRDMSQTPVLAWVVLLIATVTPLYVASTVLQPGEPLSAETVQQMNDQVELEIPPGYSLMVTAELGEDEDQGKTSYAMHIKGDDWGETISGTIKRSGGDDQDITLVADETIGEGNRRGGSIGEDFQERYDLRGSGDVTITVTNYQGGAAAALVLEVIKSPPPLLVLWGIFALVALMGLYTELKQGCDKFAGDMAAMACYAALLPQSGITPLDNLRGMAFAGLGAILLGQGAVNAVAWLSHKYLNSLRAAEEDSQEPPPPPPTRRRRRR